MRLVATIFVFVLAMNVWATGQEGDVITTTTGNAGR